MHRCNRSHSRCRFFVFPLTGINIHKLPLAEHYVFGITTIFQHYLIYRRSCSAHECLPGLQVRTARGTGPRWERKQKQGKWGKLGKLGKLDKQTCINARNNDLTQQTSLAQPLHGECPVHSQQDQQTGFAAVLASSPKPQSTQTSVKHLDRADQTTDFNKDKGNSVYVQP